MLRHFALVTTGTLLLIASLVPVTNATELAEPSRVPDVTFRGLDGYAIALADFRGKVVLLNFWGTWCAPCLQEIPELVRLSRQFKSKGLAVVGIAVDSGRPEDIRAFLAEHGMDYSILIGEMSVVKRLFHVFGFPTSVLIDRHGLIRQRYFGPQTGEVLKRDVEPLL